MGKILDQYGLPAEVEASKPPIEPFGYPVFSGGAGRLLDASINSNKKGPVIPIITEAITRSVSYWDWRIVLSSSRKLYANFDVLKGAIAQKSMHSVGRAFEPEFMGQDKAWGELATEWLRGWYQVCNVRGESFDFKTMLYLISVALDRDGDFGALLTETEDGYPQIQNISAHRIGMRQYSEGIVAEDAVSTVKDDDGTTRDVVGVYAGLRIQHGIIYNNRGRAVAARIIGSFVQDDRDVSLRDFVFRFDPDYVDQGRGLPAASGSLDFIRSSFYSHDWQQRALLIASRIGLIEFNQAGAADPTDLGTINAMPASGSSPAVSGTIATQELMGGEILYMRSNSGDKLQSFVDGKPGDQWDQFNDRIIRIVCAGLNWPYSLIWKPDGMNGTQERSAIEQARGSILDRQDSLVPIARRFVGYAISKAINLGLLPPYTGPDIGGFLNWDFSLPPEFNIDHGREDQQWRANYTLGSVNMADWLRQTGQKGDVKAHYKDRAREAALKQIAIKEIEAEFGVTIDPNEVQMLTPNGNPQPQQDPEEEEDPAPPAKKGNK